MSFNAEWTNADALAFRPYTAYASTPVTYSATTTDQMSDLRRENAELRELCASLYEFAMSEYPDGAELNFADRIRELGVEVDGC